jgi:hypothetical protein
MIAELKNGRLHREKDGGHKSYHIRPQLTEGAVEAVEPQSESCSGQDIATCNHIQIPETRNLMQRDLTQSAEICRDAEPFPNGMSIEHSGQAEEVSVLEVRDTLCIEM